MAITGHSAGLWFDFWKIRQVNLFKTMKADFGWRLDFPIHVKVMYWLDGITACGNAARLTTTDDRDVAMMPLQLLKFLTQVIKYCKSSLLKSNFPFSNTVFISPKS